MIRDIGNINCRYHEQKSVFMSSGVLMVVVVALLAQ